MCSTELKLVVTIGTRGTNIGTDGKILCYFTKDGVYQNKSGNWDDSS